MVSPRSQIDQIFLITRTCILSRSQSLQYAHGDPRNNSRASCERRPLYNRPFLSVVHPTTIYRHRHERVTNFSEPRSRGREVALWFTFEEAVYAKDGLDRAIDTASSFVCWCSSSTQMPRKTELMAVLIICAYRLARANLLPVNDAGQLLQQSLCDLLIDRNKRTREQVTMYSMKIRALEARIYIMNMLEFPNKNLYRYSHRPPHLDLQVKHALS